MLDRVPAWCGRVWTCTFIGVVERVRQAALSTLGSLLGPSFLDTAHNIDVNTDGVDREACAAPRADGVRVGAVVRPTTAMSKAYVGLLEYRM